MLINPYCTIDEVKYALGIGLCDDHEVKKIEQGINESSGLIQHYTDRIFHLETLTDFYLSDNILGNKIFFKHFPIVTLTIVESGVTLVVDVDYYLDSAKGVVTRASGEWPTETHAIKVSGTFGYASDDDQTPSEDIPFGIRSAAIEIAKRKSGLFHREYERIDGTTGQLIDSAIPKDTVDFLKSYGMSL